MSPPQKSLINFCPPCARFLNEGLTVRHTFSKFINEVIDDKAEECHGYAEYENEQPINNIRQDFLRQVSPKLWEGRRERRWREGGRERGRREGGKKGG